MVGENLRVQGAVQGCRRSMTTRVLIIGGYGNFGSFITRSLARENNIQLIIAGRSVGKADTLANEVQAVNRAETAGLDINENLNDALTRVNPDVVIHTSGPFQSQDYKVAKACIDAASHYIDLADGCAFVEGIKKLDDKARQKGVLLISGASSVPGFTSALVDHYTSEFERLETLDYGITTAQKTNRGLATTAAILSYTGKPFKTLINGEMQNIYGWQSLHLRKYAELGRRLLGNCEVPDLALFPKRYPDLRHLRFYAGLELPFIHLTLWAISWLVRVGIIRKLEEAAPVLLKTSFLFDWLGTENSAFHMDLTGMGKDNNRKRIAFEMTARQGDGPFIPCIPAILLAKKLACGEIQNRGAYPCMGFISLDEYLEALKTLDITWSENRANGG